MGEWDDWTACTTEAGNTCGRGKMTRTRSGEVKGCKGKHEKECTNEDKCLSKHRPQYVCTINTPRV